MMVDAVGLCLAKSPELLDIIVLDNQYGDILSDVCGGLAGGIGLAPGANIGDEHAMFVAAPDIACQGKPNPVALILSAGMLLEHPGATAAAAAVEQAVSDVLSHADMHTPDLGASAKTATVADAVASRVTELTKRQRGSRRQRTWCDSARPTQRARPHLQRAWHVHRSVGFVAVDPVDQ